MRLPDYADCESESEDEDWQEWARERIFLVCNNQTVTEFLGDLAELDELIKNNDCVLEVEETKD